MTRKQKFLAWWLLPVLLTAVMFNALFFVAEYLPGSFEPHSVLLVSVWNTEKNEIFRGSVRTVGGSFRDMDYDTNLSFRRIVYFDYDEVRAFEVLDRRGNVVVTIPRNQIESRDRITVNSDTGQVTRGIPFSSYGMLSLQTGFWFWVLMAMIAVFLLYTVVLLIPALGLMLTSPFRKHPSGTKRRFSGSYIHLTVCYLFTGYLGLWQLADTSHLPDSGVQFDDFFTPFFVIYLTGTIIYPFAHRSFRGKEIRWKRFKKAFEEYQRADHVSSWTETTYSDGTVTSDRGEQALAQKIVLFVKWFIQLALAPFLVYFAIIKNYLFERHPPNYHSGSKSQAAKSTPAPAGPPVPWDGESTFIYAFWQPDGCYYTANIQARDGNTVDVLYGDGVTRRVDISQIIHCNSAYNLNAECDRENKGFYYPCKIQSVLDTGQIVVVYNADNAAETVALQSIRLRK